MTAANAHEHDVDAEYLYPSDAIVTDIYQTDGQLYVTVAEEGEGEEEGEQ